MVSGAARSVIKDLVRRSESEPFTFGGKFARSYSQIARCDERQETHNETGVTSKNADHSTFEPSDIPQALVQIRYS